MPFLRSPRLHPILVILVLSFLQTWWSVNSVSLHADLLYLESIYRDVLFNGRNPRYFIFTEAFFLFPDGLIYFGLRSILPGAVQALIAYSFVFNIVYWSLLHLLFEKIWFSKKSLPTFALGSLLVILLGALTPVYYETASWPNHHGALQIFFLLWLYQLMRLPELNPSKLWQWLLLDLVLSFLLCSSDMVAAPTVFAPACVVFLIWFIQKGPLFRSANILFIVAHGLGILAAFFGLWQIFYGGLASGVPLNLEGSGKVWASAYAFPQSLPMFFDREWITLLVCFLVWLVRYLRTPERGAGGWLFVRFSAASLLLTVGTVILTGRWPAPIGFERYLQQIVYLPLIGLILWGIPSLRLPRRFELSLVVALILSLAIAAWAWDGNRLTDYPPLTACLDAHAKDLPTPWGLSRFYPAKLVTFTSRERLHLNQVKRNLSVYPWQNSLSWYTEDIYGRQISRTSFFVAQTQQDVIQATLQWGLPARRFTCPNLRAVEKHDPAEVLIYNEDLRALPADASPND